MFLNTKVGEVESKIPNVTDLAKKLNYDAKITDIGER